MFAFIFLIFPKHPWFLGPFSKSPLPPCISDPYTRKSWALLLLSPDETAPFHSCLVSLLLAGVLARTVAEYSTARAQCIATRHCLQAVYATQDHIESLRTPYLSHSHHAPRVKTMQHFRNKSITFSPRKKNTASRWCSESGMKR